MRSTDCNCKRVTTCSVNELFYFFRMGICFLTSFYNNFIFNTGKCTKFCFYNNAMSVCIFNNLLGNCNIVFERLGGCIDHNGSKSAIDTGLT